MAKGLSLRVDGRRRIVGADPNTPLLYVLRDDLGFRNPRFGCGLGQCGACTVLIDGEPVRSCQKPVASVGKAEVTTLAGLGSNGKPHRVQAAFIEEQVPQCGYCLNGWVLTAAALLDRVAKPSDAEINAAMGDVKCRCGTHLGIRRAIRRAAGMS